MRYTIFIAFFAVLACRRPAPITAPPAQPPPDDPAFGAVSAKLLSDPDAKELQLQPGEEYVQPQFTPGNPLPEYPPELVPLRLPRHVIVVRMVVDEQKRVTDISRSPLQESTASAYSERFEESVRAALQQWVVWPPAIRKFRPGPDTDGDGAPDYRVLVEQRTLKAYYDISFIFEIVDGKPIVRRA